MKAKSKVWGKDLMKYSAIKLQYCLVQHKPYIYLLKNKRWDTHLSIYYATVIVAEPDFSGFPFETALTVYA